MAVGGRIAQQDPDLAIGDLPERPTVLAGHADRMRPLFRKACFIDDQDALRIAQLRHDVPAQGCADGGGVPGIPVEHPLDAAGWS